MKNISAGLWIVLFLILSFSLCLTGCKESTSNPEYTENQTEADPAPSSDAEIVPTDNIRQESNPEDDIIPSVTQPNIITSDPTETEPSQTTESTESATNPTENTTSPNDDEINSLAQEYMNYYNLSGEEQQKFIDSFDSIEAFFEWHTAAKQAYEDNRTPIDGSKPIIP